MLPVTEHQHNLLLWPTAARGLKHPKFDQIIALADYQWPLSKLITQLKFSGKALNSAALAHLFVNKALANVSCKPDMILTVPLHWSRLLVRKYNQSELIAKEISRLSGIPVVNNAVIRVKATAAQSNLNASQRQKNVRHAFELSTPISADKVAIFDDVVTTGATVNAIAQLLKREYPHLTIQVWSICLTLEH